MLKTIGIAVALWVSVALSGAVAQDVDLDAGLGEANAVLVTHLGGAVARDTVAFLTDGPDGLSADGLAHLMVLRRHHDMAAWLFALEAAAGGADAPTLSNLSAMLVQLMRDAPDAWPASFLDTALAASRRAATLAPDAPEVHNNLGNVALALGRTDEAVAALRRATELAPDVALYWSNLARALDAAGNAEAAAEALARALAIAPNAPEVRLALADMAATPAYAQALAQSCEVDFRCQEICPRSIIGGLMSVTCEMENMSAQMACTEGRPFPTAYDCREDFPEYGILIPGLNAGFSIAAPGFEMHVLFNGEGDIDIRTEVGLTWGPGEVYLGGDGHYQGESGDVVVDNFGPGARVVLLPKHLSRLDIGDNVKIPVAFAQVGPGDGTPGEIKWFDFKDGLIAY